MIKDKLGKLVPIIMVSLALLLALAVPAQADDGATVSIGDVTVDSGKTVTLDITITDVTDLGSATIWLSYGKDVVTVDSVADGDMGTVAFGIFNTDGVTKMTCYDAYGKNGTFVFAQVTLRAPTTSVDLSCDLDLDVKEFVDTSLGAIVATVDDGSFTVKGGAAPPVGGTAYPPNKLLMVAPWIAIGAAIIVGTSLLVRRRRSAVR